MFQVEVYYFKEMSAIIILMLHFPGYSTEPLDPIHMWTAHGDDNQLWRVVLTSRVLWPMLRPVEMDKFCVAYEDIDEKLQPILDEYGFCVVQGILLDEEIKDASACWGQDLLDTVDIQV